MTLTALRLANAVAPHYLPEDFRTYAQGELLVCTPWRDGICFLPECGKPFVPARQWQIYCSPACAKAGTAELRSWGHRLALSALVWRMGKYERENEGLRALSSAARRHVGQVQSAWVADRKSREVGRQG